MFIIPPLSYFEEKKVNSKLANAYFGRASNFFENVDDIIIFSEDSSDGVELAHKIVQLKDKIETLHIIMLTDGKKIKKLANIESSHIGEVEVNYSIFDINYFLTMTNYNQSSSERVINFSEEFDWVGVSAIELDSNEDYTTFLCGFPASVLVEVYDKLGSQLLENNLRTFLQVKGKINQGIRRTIIDEPENFLAYNNGITSIATSASYEKSNNQVMINELTGWQIVNGGQTTVSLHNVWRHEKNASIKRKMSKIIVPMKIIVVSENASTELISNIAKYSNLQNKLSKTDFSSMNPFYIKMERLSRQMITPPVGTTQYGTYWYYERVKNQYRHETYKESSSVRNKFKTMNPKSQKFKSSDIAKCLNIYYGYPNIVMSGSEKNSRFFNKVVLKEKIERQELVDKAFYKKIIAILILYKKSGQLIKNQVWYKDNKKAIVVYTLALLINEEKQEPDSEALIAIWNSQTVSFEWQEKIISTATKVNDYFNSIEVLDIPIGQWVKNDECWNELQLRES